MGYSTFGNASSTSGDSPFHKLKLIPLLNKTNSGTVKKIPVWRSAAANNSFQLLAGGDSWTLSSTNSSGVDSTIATLTASTYLGSTPLVTLFHVNTAAQCMYVLLRNSANQMILVKTDDVTGTTTAIGSAFTPTTVARWPTSAIEGVMSIDGSGHMRVSYRGFYHQINVTTGSIVTQDTALVIGSYNTSWVSYTTVDGTIGLQTFAPVSDTTGAESMGLGGLLSTTSGHTIYLKLPMRDVMLGGNYQNTGNTPFCLADSDKIFLDAYSQDADQGLRGYIYRADFDAMLRSVVDWYAS